MARILLVDNDSEQRHALAAALHEKGYHVHEAQDGRDALESLRQHHYDLVITEVLLTDLDGTEVVNYIDTQPVKPKLIAFSGGNSQIPADMALVLVKGRVDAALAKPVDTKELVTLAGTLLAQAA